eukprot:9332120-Alexandrium_andersonii.AAC.1
MWHRAFEGLPLAAGDSYKATAPSSAHASGARRAGPPAEFSHGPVGALSSVVLLPPLELSGSPGDGASCLPREHDRAPLVWYLRVLPVSYTHLTLPTICSV